MVEHGSQHPPAATDHVTMSALATPARLPSDLSDAQKGPPTGSGCSTPLKARGPVGYG